MTIASTENVITESDPGNHEGCMKVLQSIITWNPDYQAKHFKQWFAIIEDLYEDTVNKAVGDDLFTEENLIILQDVLNICCLGRYKDEITDKVMSLTNLWYDVVRANELAEREEEKKMKNQRSAADPNHTKENEPRSKRQKEEKKMKNQRS